MEGEKKHYSYTSPNMLAKKVTGTSHNNYNNNFKLHNFGHDHSYALCWLILGMIGILALCWHKKFDKKIKSLSQSILINTGVGGAYN